MSVSSNGQPSVYNCTFIYNKALSNGGIELPLILDHYGDILFQLKETEEAVKYWQKALDKGSDSPLLEKKIADRTIYE